MPAIYLEDDQLGLDKVEINCGYPHFIYDLSRDTMTQNFDKFVSLDKPWIKYGYPYVIYTLSRLRLYAVLPVDKA